MDGIRGWTKKSWAVGDFDCSNDAAPPTQLYTQAGGMADEGLVQLVQLLQLLGSPDKGARQQAEAHYAHLKEANMPQVCAREGNVTPGRSRD